MALQVFVPPAPKPRVKPAILVSAKRTSVSLTKEAVALLGERTHVVLLVDLHAGRFGMLPCKPETEHAFLVQVGKSGRGTIRRGGEFAAAIGLDAGRYQLDPQVQEGKATIHLGSYTAVGE